MLSTAALASLRWHSASNLCMAARCSSVMSCSETKAMSVSNRSHAAKQKLDNRKRQYDGDDNHHRVARRDRRFGFAIGDDDGRRWRSLRDISPAFDPWYYQFGLGFIGGHRVRGSTEVWRWNRDHEVRRRLGMTHAMANPMETRR